MKIKHLLKHRKWSKVLLQTDGGLIIKFKDNSHTYLEPDLMQGILLEYNKLEINKEE